MSEYDLGWVGTANLVVVLAYASFHDVRNTFVRLRRKDAAPANALGPLVQPFARLGADGRLHFSMADVVYREAPLMRVSAVAHALRVKNVSTVMPKTFAETFCSSPAESRNVQTSLVQVPLKAPGMNASTTGPFLI